MDPFIIVAIVWFISIIASRYISYGALSLLENEQKAEMLDWAAKKGRLSLLVLVIILVVFFGIVKFQLVSMEMAAIAYLFFVVVYFIANSIIDYRKFKAQGFPEAYIKRHILAAIIRNIGVAVLFILVL